jgi:hypothetical protein
MKQFLMVTMVAAGIMVGAAYAQKAAEPQGHAAPLPQPTTDAVPSAPTGDIALGAVTIKQRVKANGETLAPGTYQLRLTAEAVKPATGQTAQLERWVEFRQGTQVRAREVVSIIPASDVSKVQKDPPPRAGSYKVEMLKGNEYVRVWINRGGNHYLLYLPPA